MFGGLAIAGRQRRNSVSKNFDSTVFKFGITAVPQSVVARTLTLCVLLARVHVDRSAGSPGLPPLTAFNLILQLEELLI